MDDCYIVEGTPFLYVKSIKALVLGDLHLGQEVGLMGYDPEGDKIVSESTVELKSHLIICICSLDVDILLFNGDIKHSTNKINKQELIELKYLYEEPVVAKIRSVIIKGNHDKLLKLSLRKVEIPIEVVENELKIGRYLFTHGHMEPQNTFDILVLSHEHPSFVLQGSVGERVKLPAFVTMQTEDRRNVIILPAANSISSGVNFPPKTKKGFLSPYLKRNAKLKTMRIFPFDYSTGVLPIPPIASWRGKRR